MLFLQPKKIIFSGLKLDISFCCFAQHANMKVVTFLLVAVQALAVLALKVHMVKTK